MRYLRNVILGIAVFAITMSLSGLAFGEMMQGGCSGCKGCGSGKVNKEAHAATIKTLRDSATALQASNPALAKGLNDLADKKAEMIQKWQAWKNKHDAKVKLLQDSAMALQKSNPVLAQELQKMSEKKYMGKEEVGETTEPMAEQGEAK